jgi:hypothetical protein
VDPLTALHAHEGRRRPYELTGPEFDRVLDYHDLGWARPLLVEWLDRGDAVAIYQNEDLGHRDLGHVQLVSYGSPAAQLPGDAPPPTTLPDIGGHIGWRYQLIATYRRTP